MTLIPQDGSASRVLVVQVQEEFLVAEVTEGVLALEFRNEIVIVDQHRPDAGDGAVSAFVHADERHGNVVGIAHRVAVTVTVPDRRCRFGVDGDERVIRQRSAISC